MAEFIRELFGEMLVKNDGSLVPSMAMPPVVGIYFSAHWCPPCQAFTPILRDVYQRVQERGEGFEIIYVSSDRSQAQFDAYFSEMPWLALPYGEATMPNKMVAAKKFKVEGIPRLVIIDSVTGKVINSSAREQVAADRTGEQFPWLPQKPAEVLIGPVMKHGAEDPKDLDMIDLDTIVGKKTIGLYFSASWCPPCRKFTPQLIETYNKLKEQEGKEFEVIYVPFDNDEDSFEEYWGKMPWLSYPFDDSRIPGLQRKFGVDGFPTLVILSKEGEIITVDGRSAVANDPECEKFPWAPAPPQSLSEFSDDSLDSVNEGPCLVLVMDQVTDEAKREELRAAILPIATEVFDLAQKEDMQDEVMKFFIATPGGHPVIPRLRALSKINDDPNPRLMLLDLPLRCIFTSEEGTPVTEDVIRTFLEAYEASALEPVRL